MNNIQFRKHWLTLAVLLWAAAMSLLPAAALATEAEAGSSPVPGRENVVVNTGTDPLWSFVSIEAPEQVLVGQQFDVKITVKNLGTGSGLFPEFQFTEESDRKPLSHFSIVGGSEGVYDTMLTEIKGGETKTFTIQMKVDPQTKELPEGSHYRINCAIASANWRMDEEKRYKAIQSFYVDVRYAMEAPAFVVEKVTFDPQVDGTTTQTRATFTLRNISDSKANNVVVALAGKAMGEDGRKNIKVMDLTNTRQISQLKGGQRTEVSYQLELDKDRTHNEMAMTIDYNGAEKAQEISLNLPLPLQDNSGGREPKVIIERYSVEPGKVLAGNYVELLLYVANTNQLPVNNVSIQLDVPTETSSSGGTVSSGTVFSPVDSSNTFYIDRIAGKDVALKSIRMYVDPNAAAKTYTMPVHIKYEGTDGTKYESSDNVNIPVTQESKVEIISSQIPGFANVGEPMDLRLEFVNIGKVALTNFQVKLQGDIPGKEDNVYYLGTFNAGESNEYTATIVPEQEGLLEGTVQMRYQDADNQTVTLEVPISCEVGPAIAMEDFEEMPMEPEQGPGLLAQLKANWLALVLGLVAAGQGVVLFRMKRRAKAEEELIDG